MTMPQANVVIPDKMQFPSGGVAAVAAAAGGANEIHQRQQWFPVDERDGFISWMRGEFAAANAIIDSLCHHLRTVGEPWEYEGVLGSIQQRRCNWNHVLHMQQYFSVGEVIFALQQVALRKQHQQNQNQNQNHHQHHHQHQRYYYNDQAKFGSREFKRFSGPGSYKGQRGGGEAVKEVTYSSVESHGVDGNSSGNEKFAEAKSGGDADKLEDKRSALAEDKKDSIPKPLENHANTTGNPDGSFSANSEAESDAVAVDDRSSPKENSHFNANQAEKQNLTITPKTFVAPELLDGKTVNVVDGLKLYERLLEDVEVSKLLSVVSDLRASGRRGQFQGQTYVVSKKPIRGHGREMIQFGLPIVDAPAEEEHVPGFYKDRRIESIPSSLQDVIERLIDMQVLTVKPDSCIIDIYNEGDHSQPQIWPVWFGKPVSTLFLTECDITFGRNIAFENPGHFRGSLKLSLLPGSLLVMQGKALDYPRHAIPTIQKQRILVTFAKSQTRKFMPSDSQRLPASQWGRSAPSRSPNHIRHPMPKHYATISSSGVLTVPPMRAQIPAANGVQPMFMAAPVAAPIPFPAAVPVPPVSTGWPSAPPRHPTARLPVPVPGTGVFLPPPGPSNALSPPQPPLTGTETNFPLVPDKQNGTGKSNHDSRAHPKDTSDGKTEKQQDCNGTEDARTATKGGVEQQSVDHEVEKNKPAGAGSV